MPDDYRVQLDVFSGPLDLLLYLIQRDEVDIFDIPVARITQQYLEYVHLLEHIDPNTAGDFLVMAATLLELKSRALLPTPPLDAPDEIEDPRASLVRQLLEYKRFKDAARALGSAADERARRFVRRPADLPEALRGVELEEVEIWDLLSAFNRVMTAIGRGPGHHDVRIQDRPIEHYEALILESLERDGPRTFETLFSGCATRAEIVGTLLALLELVRRQRVRAEQERLFGEIYLFLLVEVEPAADAPVSGAAADLEAPQYDPPPNTSSNADGPGPWPPDRLRTPG